MRAHALKLAVAALELVGVLVAIALGALVFVAWRAETGAVRLDGVAPYVGPIVANLSPAFADCEVRALSIERARPSASGDPSDRGGYVVTIDGVRITGPKGSEIATADRTVLYFAARDFLSARFGPQTIEIDDGALRVVRGLDRRLNLDFGAPAAGKQNVFRTLTGGLYFREAFERASLRRAEVTFLDEASGRAWTAPSADLHIERRGADYVARLAGDFRIGARDASLTLDAAYDAAADRIDVDLALDEAPLGDLVSIFFGVEGEYFNSPVTGRGLVSLTGEGKVLSSRLIGSAGAGEMNLAGATIGVRRIEADVAFDAARDEFDVARLSLETSRVEGDVAGVVALRYAADGAGPPRAVSFDLSANDLVVDAGSVMAEPIPSSVFRAEGRLDFADARLEIARFAASPGGVPLSGDLALTRADEGLAAAGEIRFDAPFSKDQLMMLWPTSLAKGARTFVKNRISGAEFYDVGATLNLPAQTGGGLSNEDVRLSFKARGGRVDYVPGMPPLTALVGSGEVRGDSFRFDAKSGTVGPVKITGGMKIPRFRPMGQPTIYRVRAAGDAGDALAILSAPPLSALSQTPFDARQFSGPGVIDATIVRRRPAPGVDIATTYEAQARFENVRVDGFYNDAALTDGVAAVTLDSDGMVISGAGSLGGAPIDIEWRQRFVGDGDTTVVELSGVLDSAAGDLLGVPTRQFVNGEAPFAIEARGDLSSVRAVDARVDFTETQLAVAPFDWRKPAGETARAHLTFGPRATADADGAVGEGSRRVAIRVEGPRIDVDGGADLLADGSIARAAFDAFRLDGAVDARLSAERKGDGLFVAMTGPRLDVGPALEAVVANSDGDNRDWASLLVGVEFAARVDDVALRGDVALHDAALDFRHGPDRLQSLSFVALDEDGARMSLEFVPGEGDAESRGVEARVGDIGALLEGVYGIGSVVGGEGVVSFDFATAAGDGEAPPLPPHGVLEARDLRVVDAPLLARIFAAGSLDGLDDLLRGDGIEISQAFADFSIENGAVRVRDARAAGPSVGLTAEGSFDLGETAGLSLAGAVAPVYQINSFLGKTPLIGDLFVNRRGEGVFALAYKLSGSANAPRVFVNPLSALAPGVARRAFEPIPSDKNAPPTDEPDTD
ncbi:MAG: AsmA-like C-terminal region-containing protein [Parvularculaceae bacterium]